MQRTLLGCLLGLLVITGCAKVSVEGGEKPIHIVMDINVKIDRDLDQFFAYEQSTSQPTTRPTSASASATSASGE